MQTRVKTPIRHTAEVIIAGWSPSNRQPERTGCTGAARRHLLQVLRSCSAPSCRFLPSSPGLGWPGRPPNRGPVQWAEPVVVGEVEYRAFTRDQDFR